jgi:hypothetical protein
MLGKKRNLCIQKKLCPLFSSDKTLVNTTLIEIYSLHNMENAVIQTSSKDCKRLLERLHFIYNEPKVETGPDRTVDKVYLQNSY